MLSPAKSGAWVAYRETRGEELNALPISEENSSADQRRSAQPAELGRVTCRRSVGSILADGSIRAGKFGIKASFWDEHPIFSRARSASQSEYQGRRSQQLQLPIRHQLLQFGFRVWRNR